MAGTWVTKFHNIPCNTSKWMLSIENPTSSGKIVKVYRVWLQNNQVGALTGAQLIFELRKLITLTTISAGTSVTPKSQNSGNVALGTVVSWTNRTYTTIGTNALMRRLAWSTDETTVSTGTNDEWEMSFPHCIMWDSNYKDSNVEPIVLRENQALGLQQLTTATANFVDAFMEFTVE